MTYGEKKDKLYGRIGRILVSERKKGNPVQVRNEPVTVTGSYAQKPLGAVSRRCAGDELKSGNLPESREPLNKSSSAEQRSFLFPSAV